MKITFRFEVVKGCPIGIELVLHACVSIIVCGDANTQALERSRKVKDFDLEGEVELSVGCLVLIIIVKGFLHFLTGCHLNETP